MKVKITAKLICILIIISFVFCGAGIGIGYMIFTSPIDDDTQEPVVVTLISKPIPGKPFSITASDLKYYNDYMTLIITSTAPGKAMIKVKRTKSWYLPKAMFSLSIGIGNHCGHWLPGGSFGHYWRLGSFRKFNFYFGPELMVSAYNEEQIRVAYGLYVRMLMTY